MGINSSLYVALSGLNMAQAGMSVASHNISNVNTPGFSRQRLNLTTIPSWTSGNYGQMGTGVSAESITRFHDELLTRSIVNKSSDYGSSVAQKSAIDSLEAFFNESNGNGINAALNEFFAAWDSLADAAELDPTRTELVSLAQTLADQVAMRREDMDALRADLNSRIGGAVSDINSLTFGIAKLNVEIAKNEGGGQNANDLRDTRDALLIQLGELIEVEYWETESGMVNVTVGQGSPLVLGENSYDMGVETDDSGDVRIIANYRRTSPPWPQDITESVGGGAVGGWISFRDKDLHDFYLQYESFVDNLIFKVNNQHAQGVGTDLYTDITSGSEISAHPSYVFSFTGDNNDIKITALTTHVTANEPYSPQSDPENISLRFVKSTQTSKNITSEVVWNKETEKWEISVYLPTDSNGNVAVTAEDVIRYINTEKSASSTSGTATLPPTTGSGNYKIGDFISAEAAAGNNWTGKISFAGTSFPSGQNQYYSLDLSLANTTGLGHHLSYGSEYAAITTALKGSDNDVTFTAVTSGAAGESISVEYVPPAAADQALSVTVYNDIDGTRRVSINLATDANGHVTTTAADIVELINKNADTRNLLHAQTPADQTGRGVVTAMNASYLDRSGSFEIVTYDADGEPGIHRVTVDPTDTLEDLVSRIGSNFAVGVPGIRAEVITDLGGTQRLRIIADTESGIEYGFRNDTSGALAVLGINNVFSGDSSSNIGISQNLTDNPGLLAAGRITSDGVRADGDNSNALDMADLKNQRYSFYKLSSATLGTAFNTFYAGIGSTNRSITTTYEFTYNTLTELNSQQDTLAGVNLDEELADVLRYQYMYQAAAKMVTVIDEMMQTLLAMR